MEIRIKVEHAATRCEICHQEDLFNATINFCGRCEEIKVTLAPVLQQAQVYQPETRIFQPRFLAGILSPFVMMGILYIPVMIINLIMSFGDFSEFLDLAYASIIFCTVIVAMMGVEIFLFIAMIFIIKVMISDRW